MGLLDGVAVLLILLFTRLFWLCQETKLRQAEIVRRIERIELRQSEDLEICRHAIEDTQKIIEELEFATKQERLQAWEVMHAVRYFMPRVYEDYHGILAMLKGENEDGHFKSGA